MKRWAVHTIRRLFIAVELFIDRNLSAHASALTYASVLSAVPILAIVFAIARGFGFDQLIQQKLTENVRFTPEMTDTIMTFINSYLERTRGGLFIGIGLLLLLYTLISLTSNIETAFNTIWSVKSSRNIYRRTVDYISIFFLLPIVIVVTSGLQIFIVGIGNFLPSFTFVNNGIQLLVQLSPYVLTSAAFMGLYKMMPNTDVRWSSTIVPGILAGCAFQGLQWFYIHSQVWISSYSAIYGSFAAIPLFMLWMQLSWTICLFGAQLSYANQNLELFAFRARTSDLSHRNRLMLSAWLMALICRRFERGEKPFTALELKLVTNIPIRITHDLLNDLVGVHLLTEVTNDEKGEEVVYQPAETLSRLTVGTMIDRLESDGNWRIDIDLKALGSEQLGHVIRNRKQYLQQQRNTLLKDL